MMREKRRWSGRWKGWDQARGKYKGHQWRYVACLTLDRRPSTYCSHQYNTPLPSELFTIIAEFLSGESKLGTLSNLNVACRLVRESTNAVLWTTVTLDSITPDWNRMMKEILQQDVPPDLRRHQTPAQLDALRAVRELFKKCQEEPGFLPANRIYVKSVGKTLRRLLCEADLHRRYLLLPSSCGVDESSAPTWATSLSPNLKVQMTRNENASEINIFSDPELPPDLSVDDIGITVHSSVTLQCFFAHLMRFRVGRSTGYGTSGSQPFCYLLVHLAANGCIQDSTSSDLHVGEALSPTFRPSPLWLTLVPPKFVLDWSVLATTRITADLEITQQYIGTILGLMKGAGQHYEFLKEHPDVINESDAECISSPPRLNFTLLADHVPTLIEEVSRRP
jgi:hypothetical protein